MTDIVSSSDIEETLELVSSLSAAESALIDKIRLRVESLARQYVRHRITQETYTHYLPCTDGGNRLLQLPNPYVASITSIYEDYSARGGQNDNDFPASSLLTAGTDYQLETHDLSLCRNGQVRRIYKDWSPYPHTVKVTYVAGLSASHLANEFLFVTEAIIQECVLRFMYHKEKSGGDAKLGPMISEKIGDYTVRWGSAALSDVWTGPRVTGGLSELTSSALDPIIFYGTNG